MKQQIFIRNLITFMHYEGTKKTWGSLASDNSFQNIALEDWNINTSMNSKIIILETLLPLDFHKYYSPQIL